MIWVDSYLHLLHGRAQWLVLVLFVAWVAGEFPARFCRVDSLLASGRRLVATLGRKLDRTNRSAAILVYRGIIACIVLMVPAALLGVLLSRSHPLVEMLGLVLLVLWFGQGFATHAGWKLWQRAKADTTPLELPGLDYLFADSHAVLRYSIATRSEAFAVSIVGAGLWYVVGGFSCMLAYLTLATAANCYHRSPAFGWAPRSLFRLVDALPRLLARLLLVLAGLFTPGAKPFAALTTCGWRAFVAQLLDISLGGLMPQGEMPWVGTGTARLTPQHLRRALLLQSVASVLFILLLASPKIANLLNYNI